jgi:cellulose biosynthesis protein BcsQ
MTSLTTFLKKLFSSKTEERERAVPSKGGPAAETQASQQREKAGQDILPPTEKFPGPQKEPLPAQEDTAAAQEQLKAEIDEWLSFASAMGEIVPRDLDVIEMRYQAPTFPLPEEKSAQPSLHQTATPISEAVPETAGATFPVETPLPAAAEEPADRPSEGAEKNACAVAPPPATLSTPDPAGITELPEQPSSERDEKRDASAAPAENSGPSGQPLLPLFHQKRVAVAMLKGGVGKTTITCFVATALQEIWDAAQSKDRVLVVDTDPQGSATDFFLNGQAVPPEQTLRELFFPASYDAPVPSGNSKSLIHSTRYSRVDILPAHASVADAEASSMVYPEERLARYLFDASEGYSLVLIDTPPSATLALKNAMLASSGVLVPVDPSRQSLKTLPLFSETLNAYKRRNARLTIYGILFSRCDARTTLDKSIRKAVSAQLERSGIPLFEIPNRAAVAASYNNYQGCEGLDPRKTNEAEIREIFHHIAKYVLTM